MAKGYIAKVLSIGVVNILTGKTVHGWSIYETHGETDICLTNRACLLFGRKGTFKKGDEILLRNNDTNKKMFSVKIVDISNCEKGDLMDMLKNNGFDYYPTKAFKAKPGNKKLQTSYSIKGVEVNPVNETTTTADINIYDAPGGGIDWDTNLNKDYEMIKEESLKNKNIEFKHILSLKPLKGKVRDYFGDSIIIDCGKDGEFILKKNDKSIKLISEKKSNLKFKISDVIKLIENKTGKKVLFESNENYDSVKYISEISRALKKVGLKSTDIKKDDNYPNSYVCEYKSPGIFFIKTFSDMQKLLGCDITFKPNSLNEMYIWFNF